MGYPMPGLWVTEHTVAVPLDWSNPEGERIDVFVRELVDPERRNEDLPLLTFLQGGPGGANPRPLEPGGWIAEAIEEYRIVLVDQRGTGLSTPLDARAVAERGDGRAGADHLACFRADCIVRDLEHVRKTVYGGSRWATLAQSYGGWLTLAYLSHAPEALNACYICGGVPGIPADVEEVYRRTFTRTEQKNAEYRRRYPRDVDAVSAIADHLAGNDVRLPDGDRLTVRRFQSLGLDFGMKPGFERMHWLVEGAFIRPGRLSPAFLQEVLVRTSSAVSPLFWTLQEAIYADGTGGATAWAAQRERERRPGFAEDARPLLFTGEMAFPWMFEEVRLLRDLRPAVEALAERSDWPALYDRDRLAANEVPVAAAVYHDDMYVDARLQLDTLSGLGNSWSWVTNEFEHDGLHSGRVFGRLRASMRDRGGEPR
ncbi:alpha/beta fold hydrolase [Nocardiopsis lambiniae]|uniref:Alpha/beta fold hydrolase n=1 Tax=Nocardiopsis lambiniae TaxID=3075539 RepID=A0ABU2MEW7_9ACTN|nr:alpha/beta fold hydrolase [Nocardiopsis sp. DSM 44743]MDT0331234.1 alpha/beta fold hydrolase [Nocardiopsis sp. DSM 44743]